MKVLARILSLFTLLAVATLYTSCGGDDGPTKTQEEIQLDKLKANQWVISTVDLDGTPRTTDFTTPTPMTLTFTGTYSGDGKEYQMDIAGSRPNPNPWPQSSKWKFGGDPSRQILRLFDDPDLGMGYELTDTQLTITIVGYDGAGFAGGRVEQVNGDWTFVFNKKP